MSLADQQWCPTSVQVTVLQARGLRIKGKSGTNDAYAVMQVGKEKYQTSVVEKTVAPVWKEEASFDLPPLHQTGGGGGERGTLHVCVSHRALVGPDKQLGQAVVNLLQLSEDKSRNKTEWFKLLDKNGKADKDRGEVLLDIQFMRNNMTASMFDLSAAGKSRSRLGKFKDKVRGKKKESDTASSVVPSITQVLTDSEEEAAANGDGELAAGKDEKKKKHKIKSLFSPKSNLQKNMSQSMSVLPVKNSSLSGSQSSGLNVDSSEGKKKFKFKIHKRSGSDSKDSSSGHQKHGSVEQSNLCINGSHVYCEEPPPRTSRIGSNFSLASSGHGSMEDVPESSPPSVDSLRAVRQYSPWTEEEEEDEEETAEAANKAEDVDERRREEEEERRRKIEEEEEEERLKRQEALERLAEERRRQEEEERRRIEEEERVRREEEERIRREEERRRQEEEERVRREEEERERLAEEKRLEEQERKRVEEEEKRQREEEERIRAEEERAQEQRRRQEEEERIRRDEEQERERLAEEKMRIEEQERWRMEEEERRQREEEERIRVEEERIQEERRRHEEEERIRREEEQKLEEKRRLEEERRIEEVQARKEEEERIRREEERAEEERRRKEEEERARKEKEEYERLVEEKRKLEEEERERIEAEEKIRREEEERIRMEEERRGKEEEAERARRKEEEREEKRRLEEQERMRTEEEEKRQREEEEKIRKDEERRQEEEERARKEKEECERLEEEKRRLEEQERRQKEEEERIRMEEERRRQEEEERAKKEKEEMERLAEEKRIREEQEKRRIEEEEKIKREEEERIRRVEEAERERKEEEARKLENEKLTADKEERKKRENKTKDGHKAAGQKSKVAVESLAEVTSTNPFDENFSYNPFEEIPNSAAELESSTTKVSDVQQGSAVSSAGGKTISTDEKDLISAQREKRPAPQPPGRSQAESRGEQDVSTRHLAQINKQGNDKDVKTDSVLPQCSVKMIAPLSQPLTDTKNTQSLEQTSTTKGAASARLHSKRPAPSRPRSVEESSEPKTALSSNDNISQRGVSETKQVPVVYGLNPFEDDEDELTAQDDTIDAIQWPPAVSQDAASQAKLKSSKMAHAPAPPAKKAPTPSTLNHQNTDGDHVTDDTAQKTSLKEPPKLARAQSTGEEASVKKEVPPVPSRRLQPVKPLNPQEQQSVSIVQGGKDNKSTRIPGEVQEKTKVNDTGLKGPYSQLTREELISLVLKQENQLSERDKKISELEQYIDNLLVRVMEEQPSILMSMSCLKKAV